MRMSTRGAVRRPARARAALLACMLTVGTLVACSPAPVTSDQAVEIARGYVVAGQPSDAIFQEITSKPPVDLGSTWRVQINAVVVFPQVTGPVHVELYFLIDVDKATAVPTIYTQG